MPPELLCRVPHLLITILFSFKMKHALYVHYYLLTNATHCNIGAKIARVQGLHFIVLLYILSLTTCFHSLPVRSYEEAADRDTPSLGSRTRERLGAFRSNHCQSAEHVDRNRYFRTTHIIHVCMPIVYEYVWTCVFPHIHFVNVSLCGGVEGALQFINVIK